MRQHLWNWTPLCTKCYVKQFEDISQTTDRLQVLWLVGKRLTQTAKCSTKSNEEVVLLRQKSNGISRGRSDFSDWDFYGTSLGETALESCLGGWTDVDRRKGGESAAITNYLNLWLKVTQIYDFTVLKLKSPGGHGYFLGSMSYKAKSKELPELCSFLEVLGVNPLWNLFKLPAKLSS